MDEFMSGGASWLAIGIVVGIFLSKVFSNAKITVGTPRRTLPASNAKGFHTSSFSKNISSTTDIKLSTNGKEIIISGEAAAELMNAIRENRIVEAIKIVREATGLSLVEAKAVTESLRH